MQTDKLNMIRYREDRLISEYTIISVIYLSILTVLHSIYRTTQSMLDLLLGDAESPITFQHIPLPARWEEDLVVLPTSFADLAPGRADFSFLELSTDLREVCLVRVVCELLEFRLWTSLPATLTLCWPCLGVRLAVQLFPLFCVLPCHESG